MAAGSAPQKSRVFATGALLRLFAFFADGRLQRTADALAVSAILRGPSRPSLRHDLRYLSPALFDQHAAFVESCSAFPLLCAQRRNQHDRFEPPLGPRAGKPDPQKLTVGSWFKVLEE